MEFYLYILKCNDESYYIGTQKILKSVFPNTIWVYISVILLIAFTSRLEVLAAERKIKKWTRQKKERLIMFGWSGF
ncbi:MAG: hypothetical protein US32_C0003G0014 [candidate division TM6 bacterium GW2011_GWA2_36_9]|nr:MAG: hypothetical protein US32_C0003G0014 [candidate division TM6 bacterium GW2011_GWA2_36_9]